MATITVTVGTRQADFTVDAVTGADSWTLQDSGHPSLGSVFPGDAFVDSAGNIYEITTVDDPMDRLVVTDTYGMATAPATGDGTAGRTFTTLAAAEAAIPTLAQAGDTYRIEVCNDALITEAPVTFNDTTLGSAGHLIITVPEGDRHRGKAGTGTRWKQSTQGIGLFFFWSSGAPTVTVEWLEIIGFGVGGDGSNGGITLFGLLSAMPAVTLRNLIIHGYGSTDNATDATTVRGITVANNNVSLLNCLIYDITKASNNTGAAVGIHNADADDIEVLNCTIDGCTNENLHAGDAATTDLLARNVASFRCATTGNAFTGTFHANSDHNATDATAATGGANDQASLAAADQFISLSAGAEDFHLQVGADCINRGLDLSSQFTEDLDGHDRITPWDIGADGVPLVAPMGARHRFVGAGVHGRVR